MTAIAPTQPHRARDAALGDLNLDRPAVRVRRVFLTVGTQLPFDRLVRAVDVWAGGRADVAVLAQVGPARYRPRHLETVRFLDTAECHRRVAHADVVVAHAGMGTVIHAAAAGVPVVVLPRRASLGEHRNEHQLATVARLREQRRAAIAIADDPSQVPAMLDAALDAERAGRFDAAPAADANLLDRIRAFVEGRCPADARQAPGPAPAAARAGT